MRTTRLSQVQFDVLAHLVTRGHAMMPWTITRELGKRQYNQKTFAALRDHGYIRMTDQGWLATDAGIARVRFGHVV
jgi:hypothetical protein